MTRDSLETVAHEASVYQSLTAKPVADGIAGYLPKFYTYDPENHILLLELVQDAESLREQHQRAKRFSARTAEQFAEALAALHRIHCGTIEACLKGSTQRLVQPLHQPDLGILGTASAAGVQFIKLIQKQRKVCEAIDRLREEWLFSCFIHGDVRGDNFLVPVPARKPEHWIKMFDFEYACKGDPAWDIGSAFAEYLSSWIFSIPFIGGARPGYLLEMATRPLEKIQPLIGLFWRRYVLSMKLDESASAQLLIRAVKCSGSRLLQVAMEAASSMGAIQLALLQVGTNILLKPETAAIELLGIQGGKVR
jgi:hypothetical protein